MKSERHSVLRWLEIEGVPQPKQAIRIMKSYGIHRMGTMPYNEYKQIYDSMISLMIGEANFNERRIAI